MLICCALRPLLVLFNIIPHRVTQTQAMWQLIYGPTPSVADTRAPVITRKSSSQHSIPHESGASGFLWSGQRGLVCSNTPMVGGLGGIGRWGSADIGTFMLAMAASDLFV